MIIPYTFVAGTRIESGKVNANFAALTNALDRSGDTITGTIAVGAGITIDGLDISTVPQVGGTFNPNGITFTSVNITGGSITGITDLAVADGGTGASTLTGYVKGSGTSALTASTTIPNTDITGLGTISTQAANNVAITGGSITGITDLAIADGGTGASTAQAAINALAGATTSGQYLRGTGTNVTMSAIQAGDVPTLNQSTTGSAASLSVSGQTGLLTVIGLTSVNRAKTVRDAADTLLELGGSYTPTGTWNWTSATATWPTFNQNTTGTASNVTGVVAVANGGTGQSSYTNGQLLIGNTTGNTLTKATLTAGAGITVTNGTGSITIAATNTGTVTSVSGTGTANGLTLSGTVTTSGNITLSGTVNSMAASAGTVAAPSIAASGDTNTGIYFPAADTIGITTGGVERLRFTSGTAVVIGSGEGTATVAAQTFRGAAAAGTNIAGADLTIEPSNGTGTGGSGAIVFRTAPATTSGTTANTLTDRLEITNTGNIVVGSGENTASVTANTIRGANAAGTDITPTSPLIVQAGLGTGTGYSSRVDVRLGAQGATTGTTANTARTVLRVTHQGLFITGSNFNMDSPSGGAFVTDAPAGGSCYTHQYADFGISTNSNVFIWRTYANGALRTLRAGVEWSNGGGLVGLLQTETNEAISIRTNQGNPNVQLNENLRFLTTQDTGIPTGKKIYIDGCAGTGDTFITEATANVMTLAHGTGGSIQIGPGNASASPGATILTAPSGAGTNITGANLTISAGNGTGTGGSGAIILQTAAVGSSGTTANTLTERVRVTNAGNVGIGTSTFGTSAAGVLSIANGTAPTTGPADTVQVYSTDLSAGNTIPSVYTEGTGVTTAGITNTTVTTKIAIRVNGTVYYLLATTNGT